MSTVSYTQNGKYTFATLPNENIYGTEGSDLVEFLVGNSGDNIIDGRQGPDIMYGYEGNDTFYVDNVQDNVKELPNQGTDTVHSTIASYNLPANVENLILDGIGNQYANGNDLDNIIIGNPGNNVINGGKGSDTIDGRLGADTMIGGLGDDTYYVDNAGDTVTEFANQGTDTVHSTLASYTLTANVENLILDGTDNLDGTGNDLANTIIGNAGNNVIDGRGGADAMTGGLGDDTYYVDHIGDRVIELAGQGNDTVHSAISYTLTANVENLILDGKDNLNGTGNDLDNIIIGNAGNNVIDGRGGADAMTGGAGDDTYYVDNAGDVVTENDGEGMDTVHATIDYTLGDNVENLILDGSGNINGKGNALANTITGNGGDNTLDGKGGGDHLIGGDGNDTYIVRTSSDIIDETGSSGYDTVRTALSFSLEQSATVKGNIEKLVLNGTSDIDGTGNGLDNQIIGNSGANVIKGLDGDDNLNGGGGNDTLYGGDGNDVLTGGTGADHFVFDTLLNERTNIDMIMDFSATEGDKIMLDHSIFTAFGDAFQSTDFANSTDTKAAKAAAHIIYIKGSGTIAYDDGTGTHDPVIFAHVKAGTDLHASDFMVI